MAAAAHAAPTDTPAAAAPGASAPGTGEAPQVPFWNTNLPPRLHTLSCPAYLTYAFDNAKDRRILATPDTAYRRQTWPEIREFIRQHRLDLFQRVPSDLRRYRQYSAQLVSQYGSVMDFVMSERLKWTDLCPHSEAPFGDARDFKILFNDWPYGIDERIVHLVVWTKFPLPDAPGSDDLDPEARRAIDAFVDETFVAHCGRDNVVWFKNWGSLKSIHAVSPGSRCRAGSPR